MSWRFRKSFKVMPGLRLNLTRNGVSATLGASPFSVHVGPTGVYSNTSIPGTGLTDRRRLDAPTGTPDSGVPEPQPVPRESLAPVYQGVGEVTEIRSASTEMLRSQSMADLQKLLEEAYVERTALTDEVSQAARESSRVTGRYRSWENGFLFKRMFKASFAKRTEEFEIAQAEYEELQEQLRLTTLATHIDIDPEQAEPYYRLRDAFAALTECRKIWDTLDRQLVDRFATRSAASESYSRAEVSFELGACDLIQWDKTILHLPNKTGGDLFIYPGFALYRAAKRSFAVIDTREIRLNVSPMRFIESDSVPSDAKIVGQAWAKSNKDGTPDKRFRDNYQIPIALYGTLAFTSPGGLREEFLVSDLNRAEILARAWNAFQASFAPKAAASSDEPPKKRVAKPIAPRPKKSESDAASREVAEAFAAESELARAIVSAREEFWEYLLTEELLRTKIAQLEADCGEAGSKASAKAKKQLDLQKFKTWIIRDLGKLSPMIQEASRILNEDIKSSWGKPGEAGDPLEIKGAVDRLIDACRDFLTWEIEVRRVVPPDNLRSLTKVFDGIAASVLGNIKPLPDELHRGIEGARSGAITQHTIKFDFVVPPQIANFNVEMERVNHHFNG